MWMQKLLKLCVVLVIISLFFVMIMLSITAWRCTAAAG